MSKLMIRIHNTETNEVIDREMNNEEYAQWQADKVAAEAEAAAKIEAEAKRQALFDRLGITEEEARLLLG